MNMTIVKNIITGIHILMSVILIAVILLQSGKRAGLSGSIAGAAETFFGKNKSKALDAKLSRWTSIAAIAFLVTSLYLAYDFALQKPTTPPATTEQTQTEQPVEKAPGTQATSPQAGAATSVAPTGTATTSVAPTAKPAQ